SYNNRTIFLLAFFCLFFFCFFFFFFSSRRRHTRFSRDWSSDVYSSDLSSSRRRGRLAATAPFVATRSHPAARAAACRGASACPQKPSTGIARVTGSALACRIAAAASSRCDARLTMAASGRAARAAWKSGSELTRRGRWPQLVSADAIRVEKSRSSPATTTASPALISDRKAHRLQRQPAVVAQPLGRPRRAPDHLDFAVLDAVGAGDLRFDLADQLRAQRASHGGQRHLDTHGPADDRDVVDQPQIPDVHRDLGIEAGLQHVNDLISRDHRVHLLIMPFGNIVP